VASEKTGDVVRKAYTKALQRVLADMDANTLVQKVHKYVHDMAEDVYITHLGLERGPWYSSKGLTVVKNSPLYALVQDKMQEIVAPQVMELLKPPILSATVKKSILAEFHKEYVEYLRDAARTRAQELAHNDIDAFFQEEAKYGNDSK
jgi:hypothetical protein